MRTQLAAACQSGLIAGEQAFQFIAQQQRAQQQQAPVKPSK